jgi:hypothetical protein
MIKGDVPTFMIKEDVPAFMIKGDPRLPFVTCLPLLA